ncbi:MAG TPA: hypothetical protein VMV86_06835 [Methanosarcinales archaeon]|nr:hypothetical protein [Methanosarcinales archaeon]
MSDITTDQIVTALKKHIKKTTQRVIERDVRTTDIPTEELDILCKYFSVSFVSEMFEGNYQVLLKGYNGRIKTRDAEAIQKELLDEENFEPVEPSGIASWQYADRLRLKVFRQLELIMNQGVGVAGHNQVVQAAKALLEEAGKSKKDAGDVMMAYQTQLILFAEHIVELFLPALGHKLKTSLNEAQLTIARKMESALAGKEGGRESILIWKKEIGKVIREFNQKRFELMLAETMIGNKELSEALDFSKDLIETYRQTDTIDRDSKSATKLRRHIQKRV